MSQKYLECESCGKPKTTRGQQRAALCNRCKPRTKERYLHCIDCGKPKTTKSQQYRPRCDACEKQNRRKDENFYDHCVDCGAPKSRNYYPRCKPCSKKLLWQEEEYQEKQRAYRTDPEFVSKQRDAHVAIWSDPEKRQTQRETQKAVWADPELKARHSETLAQSYAEKYADPDEYAAIWSDPEKRQTQRETQKAVWADPELKARHSETLAQSYAEKYADPDEYAAICTTLDEYRQQNIANPEYIEALRQRMLRQNGIEDGDEVERIYAVEFNDELKEQIRDRDGRRCVLCGKPEEENGKRLAVHHINYLKSDSRPKNLVALCSTCHNKTNSNRDFWRQVLPYHFRKPKQDWQMRVVIL